MPSQKPKRNHRGFVGVNRVCVMLLVLLTQYGIQVCFIFPGSRFFFFFYCVDKSKWGCWVLVVEKLCSFSRRDESWNLPLQHSSPWSFLPRPLCCGESPAQVEKIKWKQEFKIITRFDLIVELLCSLPLVLCCCWFPLSDWRVKNSGLGRRRGYLSCQARFSSARWGSLLMFPHSAEENSGPAFPPDALDLQLCMADTLLETHSWF